MSAVDDRPAALRQALWPLGLLYQGVAALRNLAFDRGWKTVHRLPMPVVSVGNLTVGGTGKTPSVMWLVELAKAHGKRPGVLARGYGRAEGAALNDEGMMLQARLPWLLQRQDPDRVAAGKLLVGDGADFIVLDDGMQHRRLHRDVDLVCLDALLPFGNSQCLPAGDLRESRAGLRRADLVLLTRAVRLGAEQVRARVQRVQQLAGKPALAVYATDHAPQDVVEQPGGTVLPLSSLRGRRAVLLSAIGKPRSFASTAEGLGIDVIAEHRYRDHHRFSHDEVSRAVAAAQAKDAIVLTTEKDDARLQQFDETRFVLRIGLSFLDGEPSPSEVGLS